MSEPILILSDGKNKPFSLVDFYKNNKTVFSVDKKGNIKLDKHNINIEKLTLDFSKSKSTNKSKPIRKQISMVFETQYYLVVKAFSLNQNSEIKLNINDVILYEPDIENNQFKIFTPKYNYITKENIIKKMKQYNDVDWSRSQLNYNPNQNDLNNLYTKTQNITNEIKGADV